MRSPGVLLRNPWRAIHPVFPFGPALSIESAQKARNHVSRCPLYTPSPVRILSGLAREIGVERIYYKDEADRFGLGSFKSLGGGYAVALVLTRVISARMGRAVAVDELARGVHRRWCQEITVVCASDGNHGRAVAAAAQTFGCRCVVYLHAGVSLGRESAIRAFGAEVVRVEGNYDDSVRCADLAARQQGWEVVADTSADENDPVPLMIMQGYGIMSLEIIEQLRALDQSLPTHIFLQAGVGGLAASVISCFSQVLGPASAPVFIVVEPHRAACVLESARAGRPARVEGDLDTLMAGLSCGEVSAVAWPILRAGADFFMSIPDDAAIRALQTLARGMRGDPPIVAGESGVAGLAGLLALASASTGHSLQEVRIDSTSRILLFGTEGATDELLYRRLAEAPIP